MGLKGMGIGTGGDFEVSGERYVIEYVKKLVKASGKKAIVFDVGANVGNYTKEVLKYLDAVEIHCFEASKGTFETLCHNIHAKNITLNNIAISDKCSEGILYKDKEKNSGLASLYNRQLDYFGICLSKTETVQLYTLDNYCKEKGISYISFLKMDIEGNELNALVGAKEMLADGRIDAIQIEFGGCNIDSRTYFRDFWNLLHDKFIVYRILSDGIYEIRAYDERLEIFTCTNYLFIRRK